MEFSPTGQSDVSQPSEQPGQPQPSRQPFEFHSVFLNNTGLRAGWRLLIFAGFLALVGFGGSLLASGAGQSHSPTSEFRRAVLQSVGELVIFGVLLLACLLMSRIERRPMGAYGLPLQRSALPLFFRGYVLWGFLPLALLLTVMRMLGVFHFGKFSPLNLETLTWALIWGAAFLVVGLFEEFLFRGYVQFTLADGIGFWPAAIVLSIGFACLHLGNSGETRIGIIGAAVFAIFAAATLWRTGNLWLAVGAHAGWDWGQSFFFGVNDSGFQAPGHLLNPSITGPAWLNGGATGPEGSVLALILLTLMTVIFLAFHRTPPKPVTIPADGLKPADAPISIFEGRP